MVLLFNVWHASTQRDVADDKQRDAALEANFDKRSGAVIAQNQGDSIENPGTRVVARKGTFSLLRRLVAPRQRRLLHFLSDSQTFSTTETAVSLHDAELRDVSLREAGLRGVDLCNADLSFADLARAELSNADMSGATLKGAKWSGADLTSANLIGADLRRRPGSRRADRREPAHRNCLERERVESTPEQSDIVEYGLEWLKPD